MPEPTKCPWCGAEPVKHGPHSLAAYTCGTVTIDERETIRTEKCGSLERVGLRATVAKLRAALADEVQRVFRSDSPGVHWRCLKCGGINQHKPSCLLYEEPRG